MKNFIRTSAVFVTLFMCFGLAHAFDSVTEKVVTATQVIYPGQTISVNMIKEVKLKRIMPNAERAIHGIEQIVGQVATQTILPNRLIFPNAFAARNIVEAGDRVVVKYNTDSVSISLRAMALEDGAEGDTIRVRNADSGRIFIGTITKDGLINVGAS
jgi:flagella basal body P-ring formation protein FlgA